MDTESVIIYKHNRESPSARGIPVSYNHACITNNIIQLMDAASGMTNTDIVYVCTPLYTAYGLTAIIGATLATGACLLIFPEYVHEDFIMMCNHYKSTVMHVDQAIAERLLEHKEGNSLRLVYFGCDYSLIELESQVSAALNVNYVRYLCVDEFSPVVTVNSSCATYVYVMSP